MGGVVKTLPDFALQGSLRFHSVGVQGVINPPQLCLLYFVEQKEIFKIEGGSPTILVAEAEGLMKRGNSLK